DRLWVDFTGSSPASRRGVNVVMNYTEAYTTYGVKVIVSPDVPNNEGAFRVLRITAPEGSILNAQHPAPVAARHGVGHFLPHVVAGALKQALPDRVMAEGSANIWGIQLSGKDRAKQPFVYTFFGSGGTGARPTKDGLSATAFPSGVLGTPVEVVETLAPLLVERKELRDGSGGDGCLPAGRGEARRLPGSTRPASALSRVPRRPGDLLRLLRPYRGSCPGFLRRPARSERRAPRQRPGAHESESRAADPARRPDRAAHAGRRRPRT